MSANLTEAELPQMLRNDYRAAFKLLYRDYYRMVEYFVSKNSGNSADAEDIFQEAMIVLYNYSRESSFTLSCSIKTYIYSVCRNLWLKQLRKRDRQVTVKDFETFESIGAEEYTEDNEQVNLVTNAMQQLGEGCRKILTLFYYHKKNMEEIAAEMGYTNADNAKNQKYKCLQHLKTKLTTTNA